MRVFIILDFIYFCLRAFFFYGLEYSSLAQALDLWPQTLGVTTFYIEKTTFVNKISESYASYRMDASLIN